ncbi:MAG TPA: NAD-dependent epimerase/dehydratase family protein [Chthoniobacterales bacterium]|nr:NAD-dependent epimerase/dehydratase family protein [Chthoniobacterales bacterium]
MKVLILGGTGFIGRHLTGNLLNAGHEVAVFHRGRRQVRFPRRVLHIRGNRSRLEESAPSFAAFSPEAVVDLIAFTEADARSAVEVFGGWVQRVVFASSMDVYQAYGGFLRPETSRPRRNPFSESSPLRRVLFPYRRMAKKEGDLLFGYEKILVERTFLKSKAFSAIALRLPQVFGPHDGQHRVREYLRRMDAGKDIAITGAKARWRCSRGYVGDIAAGFALAVTNPRAVRPVYNVGESQPESEAAWIERIGRAAGWTGRLRVRSAERGEAYDWNHNLAGDTSLIRQELGYHEQFSATEAMARTVRWERSQFRSMNRTK